MQKLLVTDFQKLFDPYYKYLITAILIVVPLFPKFPAFKVSGTYVAIRLEDFLIFGTLLIFLIPLILNIKAILKDKISRSIMLFIFIGLISLVSGVYLTQTINLKIGGGKSNKTAYLDSSPNLNNDCPLTSINVISTCGT